jgi:arabinan endo-1,5-alpha-L-arabinosidase
LETENRPQEALSHGAEVIGVVAGETLAGGRRFRGMKWATMLVTAASVAVAVAVAQLPRTDRRLRVHDPSTVVMDAGRVWSFATGHGVALLKRGNTGEWAAAGTVFKHNEYPVWHKEMVPENSGHLWAPDVIRVGNRWLVYYSVSSFGKNTSAIGLVSGKTLDPESKDYGWKDEGMVIRSVRTDRFNAIDPALVMDDGRLWMSFGSFWDGLMLVELDPETGKMKTPDAKPLQIANHAEIEAPYICKQGDWYYLFVNWGKCCRGVDSTYEIRVGRGREITGPYTDKEGVGLNNGGGTPVLASEKEFIGPGHASIFAEKDRQWLVHHYYDGDDRGRSKLRMVPLKWENGWPVVK